MLAAVTAALAVTAAGAGAAYASGAEEAGGGPRATERRTQALISAFERKDFEAVSAMFTADSVFTIPLALNGKREDAARFTGKDEVMGYVRNAFSMMGKIDFVNVRVSVTGNGKESFVQADGELTTADGRPYRNVYVYHFQWRDGRVTKAAEYANPITFCDTFGAPGC
ncbi:hypothetical protein GCM10023259_076070 [Thermocatellispora tengchongensis]